MPHRTNRRSWPQRIPLRAVILALVALATLAATGCRDDGVSFLEPDRGVAGTWVRYAPPVDDVLGDMAPAPPDTLFLASDGSGTWSRTVVGSFGAASARVLGAVQYERRGLGLFLTPAPPCPTCRIVGERMAYTLPHALYRVRRPDADRLVLEPVAGDSSVGREHYMRPDEP